MATEAEQVIFSRFAAAEIKLERCEVALAHISLLMGVKTAWCALYWRQCIRLGWKIF